MFRPRSRRAPDALLAVLFGSGWKDWTGVPYRTASIPAAARRPHPPMRVHASHGAIRAAAICYDIRFQPDGGGVTDAIAVSLEHRDGERALVVEPYAKGRLTGWRFQPLLALAPPGPRIFMAYAPPARPH